MEWLELILQIVVILASVLPLVVALVMFVSKCTKEKNWKALIQFTFNIIADAEEKFSSGPDRLDYAVAMIKSMADELQYNISEDEIKKLIEDVISVTKKVNVLSGQSGTDK